MKLVTGLITGTCGQDPMLLPLFIYFFKMLPPPDINTLMKSDNSSVALIPAIKWGFEGGSSNEFTGGWSDTTKTWDEENCDVNITNINKIKRRYQI